MIKPTVSCSRGGSVGTPDTVTEEDVASSEGAIVEGISYVAVVDGSAGATS